MHYTQDISIKHYCLNIMYTYIYIHMYICICMHIFEYIIRAHKNRQCQSSTRRLQDELRHLSGFSTTGLTNHQCHLSANADHPDGIFSRHAGAVVSVSHGTIHTPMIPDNYCIASKPQSFHDMATSHFYVTIRVWTVASKEESLMFGSCRPCELSISILKLGT